jgi:hypothetical protein
VVDAQAGIAQGVDVDGRDHPHGDAASCWHPSFTSPTGAAGVDNQLGMLLPNLQIGGQDIATLMQQASHAGMNLVLIAIDGATDLSNDPSVSVRVAMASGTPMYNANDRLLPYETFGVDTSKVPVSALPGRIVNGVLEIGPGDVTLRLRVLFVKFNLTLHDVRGVLTLTPDPVEGGVGMVGAIGGGIVTTDLAAMIDELGFDPSTQAKADAQVPALADLAVDASGRCDQVSAGFLVVAAPAFVAAD